MTEPEICDAVKAILYFKKGARVGQSNFVAFPLKDDVVVQSKIVSIFEFMIFKFTSALVAFKN